MQSILNTPMIQSNDPEPAQASVTIDVGPTTDPDLSQASASTNPVAASSNAILASQTNPPSVFTEEDDEYPDSDDDLSSQESSSPRKKDKLSKGKQVSRKGNKGKVGHRVSAKNALFGHVAGAMKGNLPLCEFAPCLDRCQRLNEHQLFSEERHYRHSTRKTATAVSIR
jgi:hypothetical protein